MPTATELLFDHLQGRLSLAQLRAGATQTCNDLVTLQGWTVGLAQGMLQSMVTVVPSSGYSLFLLSNCVASPDQSQMYLQENTGFPQESPVAGSVFSFAATGLYQGGVGSPVTGLVAGLIAGQDGSTCWFEFQQNFRA